MRDVLAGRFMRHGNYIGKRSRGNAAGRIVYLLAASPIARVFSVKQRVYSAFI